VNYWLHGEFLILKEGKMGKSERNFLTINDLEKQGFDPLAYRYFCLTASYRKPLVFSMKNLQSAKNAYERLKNLVSIIQGDQFSKTNHKLIDSYKKEFTENISYDLNMPEALATLWNLMAEKGIGNKEKYDLIKDFDKVLALDLTETTSRFLGDLSRDIKRLIDERELYRKSGNWKKADEVRTQIKNKGYQISDTSDGPKLTKV